MDPEEVFEGAGVENGLEIWRIENFRPVPFPKDQYGKFYTGDSFIVLNTNVDARQWDIHFWLGTETTQDESGTAAIFAVKLDDHLGGAPVQHREVQEHESQKFLSYFKNGVRYLPGGISSGFVHVDPDAVEKRLFQVKGSRNIRVKQVPVDVTSMNKGDCFILDTGKDIYVYVGAQSRRVERIKANGAANQIRDQDHAGKATVTIIDQYSSQSEINEFFSALGSGSPSEVPDESAGGDDEQFEKGHEGGVALYRVSDSSGKLKVTQVASKPLFQTMLDADDCFILDTGDSNVYVWIGSNATTRERQDAMTKAERFLEDQNRPKWTHIERVVQGAEPTAFTQYFRTWRSDGSLSPKTTSSPSKRAFEPTLYHAKINRAGEDFHVETVYKFTQEDLDVDDVMLLDLGDVIYIWQGKDASEEEKSKSKPYVEKFIKRNNRKDVKIVVLAQGRENEEFKSKFPWWDSDLWNNLPDIRQRGGD